MLDDSFMPNVPIAIVDGSSNDLLMSDDPLLLLGLVGTARVSHAPQ
jgi:hypothetical protein